MSTYPGNQQHLKKLERAYKRNAFLNKSNGHVLFQHISPSRISKTVKYADHYQYVRFNISKSLKENLLRTKASSDDPCNSCHIAKNKMSTKILRTNYTLPNVEVPFSWINIDVFGFSGFKFLTYTDSVSKVILMDQLTPSNNATISIKRYYNLFTSMGIKVAGFVSDDDAQFQTKELIAFFEAFGINLIKSIAYHPKSNGFVERQQQTIMNMVKAVMFEHYLPREVIPYLFDHCCFTHNISFNETIGSLPFEIAGLDIHVYPQDLTPLGSSVLYKPHQKVKGDKLYDYSLVHGLFLGRAVSRTSGYNVYDSVKKKVVVVNSFIPINTPTLKTEEEVSRNIGLINAVSPTPVKSDILTIPTFKVMKGSQIWKTAILKELNNLIGRKVLVEVETTKHAVLQDTNSVIVPTKWVMTWKGDTPKCRLVLRGDYLSDKYETQDKYSPTINLEQVKTTLVTLVKNGYYFTIADVKQAFTLGSTKNYGIKVYTRLPAFYELLDDKSQYVTSTNPRGSKECLLILDRNLYGHPLAGIVFYNHFVSKLDELGFKIFSNSPCLFHNPQLDMFALVYVDDVIFFDKNDNNDQRLKLINDLNGTGIPLEISLDNSFDGCSFKFIGLQCELQLGNSMSIKFWMDVDVSKYFTLLGIKKTGAHSKNPNFNVLTVDQVNEVYTGTVSMRSVQKLVGYLTYIVQARPEISFIVNYLQCYQKSFNDHYLKIAASLLNYLDKNPKVVFKYNISKEVRDVVVYVDSDHGANFDRFSNGCFLVFVCGVLVCGKTKLNRCVSMSSTFSEVYTINKNIDTIAAVIDLARDINRACGVKDKFSSIIYMDNSAAIQIIKNDVRFTQKFKDIHLIALRKHLSKGIKLEHVVSEENLADIGTKSLSKERFLILSKKIGAQLL